MSFPRKREFRIQLHELASRFVPPLKLRRHAVTGMTQKKKTGEKNLSPAYDQKDKGPKGGYSVVWPHPDKTGSPSYPAAPWGRIAPLPFYYSAN